jgi:hypothetical protein
MGYSFSAPCKSKKARDEMFVFLQEHYRSWDLFVAPYKDELEAVQGNGILMPFITLDSRLRGPLTDDLSYDHSKFKIGFDYGAGFSDGERYWMYNFCYWIAQRVGRRRTFKKQAPDCGAVPYVLYDGHEAWPVLERSEYEGKVGEDSEWLVDNGFRGMARQSDWEEQMQRDKLQKAQDEGLEGEAMEKVKESVTAMLEWLAGKRKGSELVDKIVKSELARLTELWEARS